MNKTLQKIVMNLSVHSIYKKIMKFGTKQLALLIARKGAPQLKLELLEISMSVKQVYQRGLPMEMT